MQTNLIFLHGGPGLKDYLQPFFIHLNSKFNCFFYDQDPGHIADLILQLDSIINRFNGKNVLVAHSWGGILGIEYAARYETKLSGLVLISTCLNYSQWEEEYKKELENQNIKSPTQEQIFLTPEEFKGNPYFIKDVWKNFSKENFNTIYDKYIKNFDVTEQLSRLKIPIINIFSEQDIRMPARIGKTFKNYNTNIKNFEIANAGHFPFLNPKSRKEIHQVLVDNFK